MGNPIRPASWGSIEIYEVEAYVMLFADDTGLCIKESFIGSSDPTECTKFAEQLADSSGYLCVRVEFV